MVDHGAGDAVPRRDHREIFHRIPVRVLDLCRFHPHLSARVVGGESYHQRARERPRLAPEVPDVRELDPDLLVDLPSYGLLEGFPWLDEACQRDRKSTRLNSSHANISYAVFCLKKKN